MNSKGVLYVLFHIYIYIYIYIYIKREREKEKERKKEREGPHVFPTSWPSSGD